MDNTYEVMEKDKDSPVVVSLVKELKTTGMFHKLQDKVVMGTFDRSAVLHHDLRTVMEHVFLSPLMLYNYLLQEDYAYLFDEKARKYDIKKEKDAWLHAVQAKPIGEYSWHRKYGKSKNRAPKFSPVPIYVTAGEEQYITCKDDVMTSVNITACVLNGSALRTVKIYTVTPLTPQSCRITMNFGALFTDTTDTNHILKHASSVRNQTFGECLEGNWRWVEKAHAFLVSHAS